MRTAFDRATEEMASQISACDIKVNLGLKMLQYGSESILIQPYTAKAEIKKIINKFIKDFVVLEKIAHEVERNLKQPNLI